MMRSSQKKSFFDPKFKTQCVNILPGEFYTTRSDEMIMTILGSCIAACVRDVKLGLGGLNHFLLAEPHSDLSSPSTRYGSYAMECLINDILRQGGQRENLEVKIFGGSDLMNSSIKIGQKNSDFIKKYLHNEGLKIAAEDLGGLRPRRIHFWPQTGRVVRLVLQPSEQQNLMDTEKKYTSTIKKKEESHGDIELFT